MNKRREREHKQLYMDTSHLEERPYVKLNLSLLPAIRKYYDISAMEIMIFTDICMNYDNNRQNSCKYSIQELADKYLCSKTGIFKALQKLIEKGLIEKLNEPKGRAKTEYIPNVKLIQKLIVEYLTP